MIFFAEVCPPNSYLIACDLPDMKKHTLTSKDPQRVLTFCAARSREYSDMKVVFPAPVRPVNTVSSPLRNPLGNYRFGQYILIILFSNTHVT